MAKKDLLKAVRDAGVVGAGGAGFPTHVKLDAKVDTVIANGAECEPLLSVDRQLMEHFPDEITAGLEVVARLTGAKDKVLALKSKYAEAKAALAKEARRFKGMRVHPLRNVYPAGDEFVLVYDVTGRLVPEGGIPLAVNVVVDNVGTLMNVAAAVAGQPVVERWLTIAGEVAEPQTIRVPIGMPFAKAIEAAGGATVEDPRVIVGGPMMGRVTSNFLESVTKTTSGLIVLPSDHYLVRSKTKDISRDVVHTKAACIQCNQCTLVCPRYNLGHALEPHRIMKSIAYGVTSEPEKFTGAFLCVECGVCTYYGCPMGLNPSRMNGVVKVELAQAGLRNPHDSAKLVPPEFNRFRGVPVNRLTQRLDLGRYDTPAPLRKRLVGTKKVVIPLRQHIGAPSIPTVKKGQSVKKGDLIAGIPAEALGANVHASISGKVTAITDSITIEGGK